MGGRPGGGGSGRQRRRDAGGRWGREGGQFERRRASRLSAGQLMGCLLLNPLMLWLHAVPQQHAAADCPLHTAAAAGQPLERRLGRQRGRAGGVRCRGAPPLLRRQALGGLHRGHVIAGTLYPLLMRRSPCLRVPWCAHPHALRPFLPQRAPAAAGRGRARRCRTRSAGLLPSAPARCSFPLPAGLACAGLAAAAQGKRAAQQHVQQSAARLRAARRLRCLGLRTPASMPALPGLCTQPHLHLPPPMPLPLPESEQVC